MNWYEITYKVMEKSTFQARVQAETPEAALDEWRQMSAEVGGEALVGAWISTEDQAVDLDSISVVEVAG